MSNGKLLPSGFVEYDSDRPYPKVFKVSPRSMGALQALVARCAQPVTTGYETVTAATLMAHHDQVVELAYAALQLIDSMIPHADSYEEEYIERLKQAQVLLFGEKL